MELLRMPECPICGAAAEERTELVHVGNNRAWPEAEQRFWFCADCGEGWLDQEQAQEYVAGARIAGFLYGGDRISNANQLAWAKAEVARIQGLRVRDWSDNHRLEYLLEALKHCQEVA